MVVYSQQSLTCVVIVSDTKVVTGTTDIVISIMRNPYRWKGTFIDTNPANNVEELFSINKKSTKNCFSS